MTLFKRKERFFIFSWKYLCSILFIFTLTSCGVLFGDEGVFPSKSYDYLNVKKVENLKLPDNFLPENIKDTYPIPDLEFDKSRSDEFIVPRVITLPSTSEKGSVLLQRLGKNRWILVNYPVSQVWPLITSFLHSNKINYSWDNDVEGVIETDWLKTSLNEDTESETFYHKYRLIVTSGVQSASTEIRVLHFHSKKIHNDISWGEESSNIDKEKNMLNLIAESIANNTSRFSFSLLAQGIISTSKVSLLYDDINQPYIFLELPIERSWASLGLALQKASFKVIDRDRGEGIYFVTRVNDREEKKEGFLSKIFRSSKNSTIVESSENAYEFFTDYNNNGLKIRVRRSSDLTLTIEEKLDLLRSIKNKLS